MNNVILRVCNFYLINFFLCPCNNFINKIVRNSVADYFSICYGDRSQKEEVISLLHSNIWEDCYREETRHNLETLGPRRKVQSSAPWVLKVRRTVISP